MTYTSMIGGFSILKCNQPLASGCLVLCHILLTPVKVICFDVVDVIIAAFACGNWCSNNCVAFVKHDACYVGSIASVLITCIYFNIGHIPEAKGN
jgi:hypothetical protein